MTDDLILSKSNSLTDLAARIRAEHEGVRSALKRGLAHAITAGELLIEAKNQLPHGHWLPWLESRCEMAERTARLYMRVARGRGILETKNGNVADLSLRGAIAIISLPKSANESVVGLVDRIADVASYELPLSAYESAEAERAIRVTAYGEADSALTRIIELAKATPALEAAAEVVWEQLGDQLMSAIADCEGALRDDFDLPFALAPSATAAINKARNVAREMLRQVEDAR